MDNGHAAWDDLQQQRRRKLEDAVALWTEAADQGHAVSSLIEKSLKATINFGLITSIALLRCCFWTVGY